MNTHRSTLLLICICIFVLVASPIPAVGSTLTPIGQDQPLTPEEDTSIFLPVVVVSNSSPPPPTPPPTPPPGDGSWPMVAANPQRTSWTPEEVTGNLHLEWYRPIEAYIPQNAQVIAEYGRLYISTAKGLIVLNATNGDLLWRFNTEMPLGNSPTVIDDVVYVAGYDRKLHALDAYTGAHLWSFDGARAGYDTNPLVVEGKVILGNRDGNLYAIGAHGTQEQGTKIWMFATNGAIHFSPAYKDGVVYFASNDNFGYAVRVQDGSLVWKSQKLPGDGFHTYWPVIYRDKVIFAATHGYRVGLNPGTKTLDEGQYHYLERDDLFPNQPDGTLLGPEVPNQPWSHGYPVFDASRITEYHENNPNQDPNKHKPWRRVMIMLNQSDGSEYTFDSDGDGYSEYIPVVFWGTQSGNSHPPVVGSDGLIYMNNLYQKFYINQGRVTGWNIDTPSYLSMTRGQGAIDEPQTLSSGGNVIYRLLGSDNVGDWFSITESARGSLWHYATPPPLVEQAPGYDVMYWKSPDEWNFNVYGTLNGIYGHGAPLAPIVPYQDRLYSHRSNSIVVYGTGPVLGKLPMIEIEEPQTFGQSLSVDQLKDRLEDEITKIIQAGHLRPGYLNNGMFVYFEHADYFDNPGDTLYTLSMAYPYLSPGLQAQTKTYLESYFDTYFNTTMYTTIGWSGAAREATPLPPEVEAILPSLEPGTNVGPRFTWNYPPHNFYALWKYAQIASADVSRAYELAKSKIQVPVPDAATADHFLLKPWEHNAYMTGYVGFLKLQELAGMHLTDSALRQDVLNELDRLIQLRPSTFDKDTPFVHEWITRKVLNIARNFMMISPEVGEEMKDIMLAEVQEAVSEYEFITPYWFVSRYEDDLNEGVISNLYTYQALFAAKAYILNQPRAELSKYIDAAAFSRGDLFYIQNLIAAIEAP